MQATQVQAQPQTQLRDVNNGQNAQGVNTQNLNYGYNPATGYRNTSMQQQIYPPVYNQFGNQYANQQYANQQYGNAQQSLPPSTMRDAPGGRPGQQTGVYQTPVVSNDPRFVMQAPAPRLGNYPTVPYQPPFRTVSMQLPQQNPQVLPVQSASTIPNQPQTVPVTSALPQNQPVVGAQLVNYQALQPGYCAPNNGVPAYVPGAVAPPTLPPNLTPQLYTPDNSGYRPLFSLGQENYNVQIGRGIIGQPTVYVPGQPVRNFMRYLFP